MDLVVAGGVCVTTFGVGAEDWTEDEGGRGAAEGAAVIGMAETGTSLVSSRRKAPSS